MYFIKKCELKEEQLQKIYDVLNCFEMVHERKKSNWRGIVGNSNVLKCKFEEQGVNYELLIDIDCDLFRLKRIEKENKDVKLLDIGDLIVDIDNISMKLANKLIRVFEILGLEDY